jgi:hypothetical protein
MSKLARFLASAALIFSVFAFAPGSADAHWRGGYWRGGWGWGPAFGLGLGLGYGWGWGYPYAYYPGPYYYGTPYYGGPACGWARVRVWRNGHWVYRRAWRC